MDDPASYLIVEQEKEGRLEIQLQRSGAPEGYSLPRGPDPATERRGFTIPEVKELLSRPGLISEPSCALLLAYLRQRGHFYQGDPEPPGLVGIIGRFKPFHLGHEALLRELCRSAGRVRIGIGSANRYGPRNPFTVGETCEMIHAVLSGASYDLVPLDDYGHLPEYADGSRWRQQVVGAFAGCSWIVSGNPHVAGLLGPCFRVLHPIEVLPPERWVSTSSSAIRKAMAAGRDWQRHVPAPVAKYMEENRLVARFRREFAPVEEPGTEPDEPESLSVERARIQVG